MSSDIVLTAALRNNLLSLQNTQRLIDTTQLRLATGLKVNSALDNPTSFFTAQTLNNRAGDLERLLDSINLSIRTIEEADAGVSALTSLIEQAQSITNSARDELAASEGTARVIGNVDLSAVADITTLTGIANADVLRIVTTDDSGTQILEDIAIATGDTAYTLAAKITDQFADNENGEITAEITSDGFLSIQSSDGRSFRLTAAAAGTALEVNSYASLGLGDVVELENDGTGATDLAGVTVVAGNTLSSISIYEGAGDLAEAGDFIEGTFLDADGNTIISGVTGTIVVSINNTTNVTFTPTATSTFQDLVDTINQDATVNQLISANFDSSTGQLSFTSLDDSVDNLQFRVTSTVGPSTFNVGFGDPSGNLDPVATTGVNTADQTFAFNNSTQALDSFASDYNIIREQINQLVVDANFRGVNLLNGDDLVTFFNENNSSSLTTRGATFTADGLGLTEASFRSSSDIELSASQVRSALGEVRAFGSTLANSINVIQTRRDFTEATINTLTAGADDLTVADANEEGANLLALQTRQALGTTSLSLASQSQQSVLRLF